MGTRRLRSADKRVILTIALQSDLPSNGLRWDFDPVGSMRCPEGRQAHSSSTTVSPRRQSPAASISTATSWSAVQIRSSSPCPHMTLYTPAGFMTYTAAFIRPRRGGEPVKRPPSALVVHRLGAAMAVGAGACFVTCATSVPVPGGRKPVHPHAPEPCVVLGTP